MIDIIGNIKIDEKNPIRVQNFVATLHSYKFLTAADAKFYIAIEAPSTKLERLCERLMAEFPIEFHFHEGDEAWGAIMRKMIGKSTENDDRHFYAQFEEDHFCECNDIKYLLEVIGFMRTKNIQLCRASFHAIETESARGVIHTKIIDPDIGSCFEMNYRNYQEFQLKWPRYYVGTNCIFSKRFAARLYDKPGKKPHEYELATYHEQFLHQCLIPKKELLRSLDDDHGLVGSSMVLKPTDKYKKILVQVARLMKSYY